MIRTLPISRPASVPAAALILPVLLASCGGGSNLNRGARCPGPMDADAKPHPFAALSNSELDLIASAISGACFPNRSRLPYVWSIDRGRSNHRRQIVATDVGSALSLRYRVVSSRPAATTSTTSSPIKSSIARWVGVTGRCALIALNRWLIRVGGPIGVK